MDQGFEIIRKKYSELKVYLCLGYRRVRETHVLECPRLQMSKLGANFLPKAFKIVSR